jgi:hypothetical protein
MLPCPTWYIPHPITAEDTNSTVNPLGPELAILLAYLTAGNPPGGGPSCNTGMSFTLAMPFWPLMLASVIAPYLVTSTNPLPKALDLIPSPPLQKPPISFKQKLEHRGSQCPWEPAMVAPAVWLMRGMKTWEEKREEHLRREEGV